MRPRTSWLPVALALAGVSVAVAQDWKGLGRIQGRVTTEAGEPVAGAAVRVYLGKDPTRGPEPTATSQRGRWAVLGLGNGTWTLVVEKEGFVPSEGRISVSQGRRNLPIEVRLRRLADREAAAEGQVLGRIEEANRLMVQGRYAEARTLYEEVLPELDPQSRPALLQGVVQSYLGEGALEAARATLDELLGLDPESSDALVLKARILAASGKDDEAISTLKEILSRDPNHVEVLRGLTHQLLSLGREAEARVYLDRLPAGTKVDPDLHLNLGIERYNAGQMAQALGHFQRAATENPDMADVYYYRGLTYLATGETERAKTDFEKLLVLDPEHHKAAEVRQFLAEL